MKEFVKRGIRCYMWSPNNKLVEIKPDTIRIKDKRFKGE